MAEIPNQIRLPIRVAYEVVMQGIRIRFGRSLVTITGVIFGIAFLMSILTGQVIKGGVREEDRMRTEIKRMSSFLTAEMGPALERKIGVIQTGPLSEMEQRFLNDLFEQKLKSCHWAGANPEVQHPKIVKTAIENIGTDSSAVMIMGAGSLPQVDLPQLLSTARQKIIATTNQLKIPDMQGIRVIPLSRELREDERVQLEKEKRKESFRNAWILIISLLVTIIGISNAMLMSVTERFREIGTMKCLGALSSFIRQIFLLESSLMGIVGGIIGSVIGSVFSFIAYGVTYGFGSVFSSLDYTLWIGYFFLSTIIGVVLSIIAAIYPAIVASKMVPADALRSNV